MDTKSWPLNAENIQSDDVGMEVIRLQRLGLPHSHKDAFLSLHLQAPYESTMNLIQPYGDGNHRRIKWRKSWDVDREKLTATHRETGFAMAFTPQPGGGYTARVSCKLPAFGPDGRDAVAQMFGMRELMMDAWDIFHTVTQLANRP